MIHSKGRNAVLPFSGTKREKALEEGRFPACIGSFLRRKSGAATSGMQPDPREPRVRIPSQTSRVQFISHAQADRPYRGFDPHAPTRGEEHLVLIIGIIRMRKPVVRGPYPATIQEDMTRDP